MSRSVARGLPWGYRVAIAVVRPLLMALTKRDWRGGEHLPARGGFVAAVNHLSYVDPLTFAHYMLDHGRPVSFLAKESIFRVPVVGPVLRAAGQIPVYRGTGRAADAFRAAVQAVERGTCVGILPEGTLTRDPDLWPMTGKTGAARVALATRCPVIPLAQWGPERILPPYGHRIRLLPRRTVHVWAGPPVDLADLYEQPVNARTLRVANDRIMEAITQLLEQIRGEQAPASRFDPRAAGVAETGNPNRRRRGSDRGTGGDR
ncbi:MAG TPA: 1-acyl-sn-glycerol-3-phosphate acyltransferase [Segeticoccus sp.]|uniref:lysophospholipid acyltransferase family protein n=1 Tax=Segeticoccus sp. TaxID=2706531 RepID=UPI002D8082EA|nr:1-acyl-sn-glycerol-3-phosphate acyltransferase [Segeticoccus sp.]HET8601592.1 1-acyl-sn-glycerol-3-phosphate acyltransferase [Segeticoccus sp.]